MEAKGIKFLKDGLPEINDGLMTVEHWGDLFLFIETLGGGTYGSVNLAQTLNGQTKVVVKFINVQNL